MTAVFIPTDDITERIDPFATIGELEPLDAPPAQDSEEAPPKRKRRTKAEMEAARLAAEPEEVRAPRDVPMPEPKKRGRKPKAVHGFTEAGVRKALPDIFQCIAFVRPYGMWERTEEECEPLVGPLTRLLNRLPADTVDKVLALSDPIALAYALTLVAGPSVILEIRNARASFKPKGVTASNVNGNDGSGTPAEATRPDGTPINSLAYGDNISE